MMKNESKTKDLEREKGREGERAVWKAN